MAAIYLDNNATTPLDPLVLESMLPFLTTQFGNPASSTHTHGWFAAESVTIARERVAKLIGAAPAELVFTSGATESNNLALQGAGKHAKGGHFVTQATEHKSVLDTLQALLPDGFAVSVLAVDSDGRIGEEAFVQALRGDTICCSVMLGNNEIGAIEDVAKFARIASARGILVHCDATQALGRIPVDVGALGVDLLSCSAHKLYGPKGAGALWIKPGVSNRISAQQFGGGHELGLRSGTLNVPAIVGFGKACELAMEKLSSEPLQLHRLCVELITQLRTELAGAAVNGPVLEPFGRRLPGNLNLRFAGVSNARLIGAIQTKLSVSTSSACQSEQKTPSHVLQALGLSLDEQRESFRLGLGRFTTAEDTGKAAEILIDAVKKIRQNRAGSADPQ